MILKLFSHAKNKKRKSETFRLLENTHRYTAWSGTLPLTPLCTHYLQCISTIHPDPDGRLPEKQFPSATHEIRLGYRLNLGNRPLSLLYHAQFDFNGREEIADWVADRITSAIAIHLKKTSDRRLLLRSDPDYWYWFIRYHYQQLR